MADKNTLSKKNIMLTVPEGRLHGRILKGVGGAYEILLDDRTRFGSKPRGIFRKKSQSPLPGDHVVCQASGDSDFPLQILEIKERRNVLVRPLMANLDLLILTFAVTQPEPDLLLLDKLLVYAVKNDIEPLVCFTKSDLDHSERDRLLNMYSAAGFRVISSSPYDWADDEIRELIHGRVVTFAGPSGVGKSTLLNQISGEEQMDTGDVSDKIGRGRHTTRHTELFPMAGGFLVDTPGFTSLEIEQLNIFPEELVLGYPEFQGVARNCRFQDCHHLTEIGCAVKELAAENKAVAERYDRYAYFRVILDRLPIHHWKKKED